MHPDDFQQCTSSLRSPLAYGRPLWSFSTIDHEQRNPNACRCGSSRQGCTSRKARCLPHLQKQWPFCLHADSGAIVNAVQAHCTVKSQSSTRQHCFGRVHWQGGRKNDLLADLCKDTTEFYPLKSDCFAWINPPGSVRRAENFKAHNSWVLLCYF